MKLEKERHALASLGGSLSGLGSLRLIVLMAAPRVYKPNWIQKISVLSS